MNGKIFFASVLIILAIVGAGAYYWRMQNKVHTSVDGQPPLPTQTITIGSTTITAEIALSDDARQAGLSNRASLTDGRGMLFVFSKDGNWGIWMPDMRFSIDIIWSDAMGTVVALDSNISPESYPNVFYPNKNARYVLELPAGYTARNNIMVGSRMSLPH